MLIFLDKEIADDTCYYHHYAAYLNCQQSVIVKYIFHEPAKAKRGDDFWQHNEKIEDAHVHANALCRQYGSEHSVWH